MKRFKGLLYLLLVVLLLALGTAGGLYWINQQAVRTNQRLVSQVEQLRKEISALRYDKDVLTTRLVLTEAQLKKKKAAQPSVTSDSAGQEKTGTGTDGDDAAAAGDQAEAEQPTAPAARTDEKTVEEISPLPAETNGAESKDASATVSVKDLTVAHESSLLRVSFLIRKEDQQQDSVSGYAFVVLKPEGKPEAGDWIPLPWAAIESGRPSPPKRGQFFSIARFKPMKFETRSISDPDRIAQLTVFVFDTRGELLLEQDFQLPEGRTGGGAST